MEEAKKHYLQHVSERYKKALEEDFDDIKDDAIKYAKIAGVAAAGMLTAYILVRMLTSGHDEDVHTTEYDGFIEDYGAKVPPAYRAEYAQDPKPYVVVEKGSPKKNQFLGFIEGVATSFLITFAREQVLNLVNNLTTDDEPQHEQAAPYPETITITATEAK